MTAAGCVSQLTPNQLLIVAGTNNLNSLLAPRYAVQSIHFHPNYNVATGAYDVALLKMAQSIQFNSQVGSIQLSSTIVGGNVNAIVSGWGSVAKYASFTNNAKELITGTLTTAQCRQSSIRQITDSMLCTSIPNQGTCYVSSDHFNGKHIKL